MSRVPFHIDGQPVTARPGDTLAAALATTGTHVLGTRKTGAPRGLFCGMGICQDCLVTINGQRSQRACLTKVAPGMEVWREDDRRLAPGSAPPDPVATTAISTDIAIIGAGPAGLAAARHATAAGADVVILDERDDPGGQYFKPRSTGYRGARGRDRQHRRGDALRAAATASGARIVSGQTVWFARRGPDGFDIRSLGAAHAVHLTARTVILATGAYERPAIVPGWTLPGVMTIGAAQTLARRYGVLPGRRVLIAGHGPLGLQLAAEIGALGGQVVALADRGQPRVSRSLITATLAAPRLAYDGLTYGLAAYRRRIPLLFGWELDRVCGTTQADGAVLRNLTSGQTRRIEADVIAAGDGFAPQIELARLLGVNATLDADTGVARPTRAADGATEVPGLWIAGDAGGLGGAEIALCQGQLSAAAALRHLGQTAPPPRTPLRRAQRFQTALWSLYHAAPRALPADDTILCRCESVTTGTARAAITKGAADPALLKRETRIGMGRCQGRYCLPLVARLLAEARQAPTAPPLPAPQIPARPVPLGALALEKPEWSGHRDSALSVRPPRDSGAPLAQTEADLIVIGAGITGISAAYYAARAGASVICLDRGAVNGEASGGNAGSLHLQLLSWDFGGKAVGGGDLQLRTLPLQQESIALWQDLEQALGADFEMDATGGMMVAERSDQIAFLEDKVKAEARMGIATEVIDAARIRQIVPHISDRIVAAAWCPGEGKINPLAATPALARAARAAGARIEPFTPVDGLRRDGTNYEVRTPRGTLRAPRLLLAAGGWSTQVAAMLGSNLPIKGAPLQMVVTAPGPPLVPCLLAHADRHLTMKQAAAGSVIIGGAWPARTNGAGFTEVLPESLEGNVWVAGHTVPAVGQLQVIRSWAAMNIDIDGAPVIGPLPGADGVTLAATANGYTLGPFMGREAASAALSGRLRQDLEPFSMARFT